MMLLVAGHANSKNLLERAVLSDMLRIEICTVYRIVSHSLDFDINDAILCQLLLFIKVRLVFDDNNVIIDDRHIFGITSLAGSALRCRLQCLVQLFNVTALSIIFDTALFELGCNPKVCLYFLLCHYSLPRLL